MTNDANGVQLKSENNGFSLLDINRMFTQIFPVDNMTKSPLQYKSSSSGMLEIVEIS